MNLCKGCSRRLLCGNEFTQNYCTGFQRAVNLQIDIALNLLEESLKRNKQRMILEQGQIDDLREENLSLQEELAERDHYDELDYERELYNREEGWSD